MSNIKYRLRNRTINVATKNVTQADLKKEPAKRTEANKAKKSRTAVASTSSTSQTTSGNVRKRRILDEQQTSSRDEEAPPSKRKCELKVDPRFDYDGMQAKSLEHVPNYAFEIFQFMRHREKNYQLPATLASCTISEIQRAVVIDWLIECQESYEYTHETLYIAVRLFDTYLAAGSNIHLNQLQLLGGACFLVASKYEEYEPILLSSLIDLCANTYSHQDFIAMELEVIRAARCDLGFPLSYSFLRRFARVIRTNISTLTMARFVLETSLHYYQCVLERPSKVAAAALVLALKKSGSLNQDWVPCLEYHSGFSVSELSALVQQLDEKVSQFTTTFPACTVVVEKYSDTNFFEVAKSFLP